MWGTRADTAAEDARRRALEAAAAHALGEPAGPSQRLAGGTGGLGCVSALVALPCGLAGVGLLLGPYGTTVQAVAAGLLFVAIAVPFLGPWAESRLTHRGTWLYVFEGGAVLVRGADPAHAVPWSQLVVTERTESGTYGQGGNRYRAEWLHLAGPGGVALGRVNASGETGRALVRARSAYGEGTRAPEEDRPDAV
ncbi:hypothetical protein AB0D49_04020 [Streptomyces sp. NPDC048290]|uniref:hypothetical protein n=1 Tax=Streptomyces sp. NPDC048290 TaxID=3155811 RepID=UPI0034474F12